MKKLRTMLALLTAGALLVSSACDVRISEQNTDYRLVRSVTEYSFEPESEEWIPKLRKEYSYEKGYPVSLTTEFPDGGLISSESFRYIFDDEGQPVIMMHYNEKGQHDTTTEYNKSRVWERTSEIPGETKFVEFYQYGDGDGYFTLLLNSRRGYVESFLMEEVDSVSVTAENGLLKKTVNTGMHSNQNQGNQKEWQRFNGIYTANYDGEGIINNTLTEFREGTPGSEDTFRISRSKGRIDEVEHSVYYRDRNETVYLSKYTFEYTDIVIDDTRYAAMINSIVMGENNNFYRYFWY